MKTVYEFKKDNDPGKITFLKADKSNMYFELIFGGFVGEFRIVFIDNTRKNSLYKDLKATETYLYKIGGQNFSDSFPIRRATDAMLFVERRQQWILEIFKF
jgi:hypothetical protein